MRNVILVVTYYTIHAYKVYKRVYCYYRIGTTFNVHGLLLHIGVGRHHGNCIYGKMSNVISPVHYYYKHNNNSTYMYI